MKCLCQQHTLDEPMVLCELHAREFKRRLGLRDVLLREALEALIWCSGSDDFQTTGKAALGWHRGPRVVIDKLREIVR